MALGETAQFILYPVFQAPNVSNATQMLVTVLVFYGPVALIPRLAWAINRHAKAHALGTGRIIAIHGVILLTVGSAHMVIVTLGLSLMHAPEGWGPHLPRFVGEVWLTEFPRWALVYGLVVTVLYRFQKPVISTQIKGIEIRENGRVHFVQMDAILWAEATGNYIRIHTGGRSFTHRESLAKFEQCVGQADFTKVHRGVLVRTALVRSIRVMGAGRYRVVLSNGDEVPLSRRRVAALREALVPR